MSQKGAPEKCSKCDLDLPMDGDIVICYGTGKCHFHNDIKCSGMQPSTYSAKSNAKKMEWICQGCRSNKNKEEKSTGKSATTPAEGENISKILEKISKDVSLIPNLQLVVSELQNKVEDFRAAMDHMSNTNDEILKQYKKQEEKIKKLEKNVKELEETVKQKDHMIWELREDLDELQQYSRNRNAEIVNIPEKNGTETEENLLEVIEKIAEEGNIQFNRQDVDIIHRVPSKKKNRPRNVVVQFKTRTARNKFLENKKHGVTVKKIVQGSQDTSRIFLNEHLTAATKHLLWRAKQEAKAKSYQAVWVRDGKIFLKKQLTDKASLRIRNERDLERL